MKSRKPVKRTVQGKRITDPDVRPLDQRERPLNTRKGIPPTKFADVRGALTEYAQTEIDFFR